jgi:hypothetical protein
MISDSMLTKRRQRISFAERLAGDPEMMQQFDSCAAHYVTSLAWISQHSAQYALNYLLGLYLG